MEKISVFNYEVYYLDFLEGNLNKEDTVLFLAFLEANPELKMDDDSLPSFSKENDALDLTTKESLKHHSEDEKIIATNIEHFLIAQSEGILSKEKIIELNSFILGNGTLEKEKAMYTSVHFEADKNIVFDNKESLKRKRAIILWPYYAAAASVLIALISWYSSTNGKLENKTLFADKKQKNTILKEKQFEAVKDVYHQENEENNTMKLAPNLNQNSVDKTDELAISINEKVEENKNQKLEETPFQNKEDIHEKTPAILESIKNEKLIAVSQNEPSELDVESVKSKEYASVYFSDVENPIEPVTSFIGEKTNTKIDFRRQKKTKTKPSKVFVKVGKFEFSRKKH
tara:strand:- start:4680 stop:5708 length:1029 start_codon:yes stop_codon:yes gene_type:complete